VANVFSDRNISGKKYPRPELTKALDSIKKDITFIADTWDRVARDMLVSLTIVNEIEQRGGRIETADGVPPRTTPEGELVGNILSAIAQYRRQCISKNTKRGLAKKKEAGQYLGRPPYGYRVENKKLVEDKHEQTVLKLILSYQRFTANSIAKMLNLDCIPCRGNRWTARTIRKILARETS
jgi:DNA invertase Pin-like site-specific DNA recombinase